MRQIENDNAWKWANNEDNKGELHHKSHDLSTSLTTMQYKYLTEDFATLKRKQQGKFDELKTELETMLKDKAPILGELVDCVRTMQDRHAIIVKKFEHKAPTEVRTKPKKPRKE